MTVTQTLAALIGLYFTASGIGLIADRNNLGQLMRKLQDQPLTGYLAGVVAFTIGSAIVALHNDWSTLLAGFVSLIGWISLSEGMLILAFRKWFLGLFTNIALSTGVISAFGIGTLSVGLLLLAAVFFG